MKYYTYKMDLLVLNVLAVVLVCCMVFITYLITGTMSFIENINLMSFIILILWMFLHEILHGVGFFCLGKVKAKNIVFGAELEKGIFYCMCKQKISKLNILVALVFPLFFIGILTYVLGIIINNDLLIFLSIVNIAGATGDILMIIDIIMMPKKMFYLDLDDTTSFTILTDEDLKKKKFPAIKLDKYGVYDSSVKAKDYKKLKISKNSIYFFIGFIILIIIAIFDMFV